MKPKAKETPSSRAEIPPTPAIETTITLDAVARVALYFLDEQDEHDKSRRKEVPKDTWPEIKAIREAIEFLNRCASLLSADADWKQRDVAAAEIAAKQGFDLETNGRSPKLLNTFAASLGQAVPRNTTVISSNRTSAPTMPMTRLICFV